MRTHYDNLKVSETAPVEVIRAAYRALCQKMHPDRNPNNPDAHRIMQILNDAYAVLSDPVSRAAYDERIRNNREREQATSPFQSPQQGYPDSAFRPGPAPFPGRPPSASPYRRTAHRPSGTQSSHWIMRTPVVVFVAVFIGIPWLFKSCTSGPHNRYHSAQDIPASFFSQPPQLPDNWYLNDPSSGRAFKNNVPIQPSSSPYQRSLRDKYGSPVSPGTQ